MTRDVSVAVAVLAVLLLAHLAVDLGERTSEDAVHLSGDTAPEEAPHGKTSAREENA
jgi:hypothetical protein